MYPNTKQEKLSYKTLLYMCSVTEDVTPSLLPYMVAILFVVCSLFD